MSSCVWHKGSSLTLVQPVGMRMPGQLGKGLCQIAATCGKCLYMVVQAAGSHCNELNLGLHQDD